MGLIAVEGMEFYAYHGYYAEERRLGGRYSVDVYLHTDFSSASADDNLSKTINYEGVYSVVKERMSHKTKLLETLAEGVCSDLKARFVSIANIKVRVNKWAPPLGGKVERTYVEVEHQYKKKCGKCAKGVLCYNDGNCWCTDLLINKETLAMIKQQYTGCLCPDCLKFYS